MADSDRAHALIWDTAAGAAAYRRRDMRLARQLIFPAVLDRLGSPPSSGAVAIDLGCGTGVLAAHIARARGWTVKALDISPHMLDVARTDNPHPGVDYILFGGRSLSEFEDDSIDAAVCCLVYCTDPDDHRLAALTAEIHRVLRPGGPYILADLNPDATGAQFSTLRYGEPGITYADGDSPAVVLRQLDGTDVTMACHFRSSATYASMLTAAGFPAPEVELPTAAMPPDAAESRVAPYMVLTTHAVPAAD
ncbi:class I SAM-dependent methyltransferase [Nocardia goodfellowii]|uniref:SAM-dependent methyltransferase n=1 Tax=Nocardia goodfellowii TaxID=882446 RepID=A0ABS4QN52_9NOCA|nr:class I SAM-dependent methyltransferase [Nocardia goodfellowii]MBP2193132.1 SAM-dependent methyltransferase [Nocardia goodfellowii]